MFTWVESKIVLGDKFEFDQFIPKAEENGRRMGKISLFVVDLLLCWFEQWLMYLSNDLRTNCIGPFLIASEHVSTIHGF